MSLEFRHLRYFVAVAEELSLNRAAMRLGLSQSTLNRQLSELEDQLGVQLLWRSRQGVRLTEAGQKFLDQARALLWEQTDLAVAIRETGATKITVAYLASTVFGPVGEAIADIRQERPWLRLEMVEATPGPALEQVATGQADLAFVGHWEGHGHPGVEARPLYEIPLAAALPANHRLATSEQVRLEDLSGEAFLGLREDLFPGRQAIVRRVCRQAGFELDYRQLADSLLSLLTLVGHGQGVSLVPTDAGSIAPPQVVLRQLTEPAACITFHALARRGSSCPEIRELLRRCQEKARLARWRPA